MNLSRIYRRIFLVFIISPIWLFSGCGVRTVKTISESTLLSKLPDEIPGEIESEPGCSYTTEDLIANGYILVFNSDRSPWIGLKTGPQRLEVKSENFPSELGGRGLLEYSGPNIDVSIYLQAPKSCPHPEEDCLFKMMTGTLQIRRGEQVERLAIIGSCGC
jgi:hypothetical protein